VTRKPRDTNDPVVHYGLIGSANQVMRHGATREKLRQQEGMLCFEKEAAGLVDNFKCVVIRGISDYSDSHSNELWLPYAAAVAAAYAKELLETIPPIQSREDTESINSPPFTMPHPMSWPQREPKRALGASDDGPNASLHQMMVETIPSIQSREDTESTNSSLFIMQYSTPWGPNHTQRAIRATDDDSNAILHSASWPQEEPNHTASHLRDRQ